MSESALAVLMERLHEGLQPPANLSERDEAVRVRMERCLRGRWHDVRVGIYGSAGSGLRVGASSDVDMCAFFPRHHQAGERVHALLRAAEAALLRAEAAEPAAVAELAKLGRPRLQPQAHEQSRAERLERPVCSAHARAPARVCADAAEKALRQLRHNLRERGAKRERLQVSLEQKGSDGGGAEAEEQQEEEARGGGRNRRGGARGRGAPLSVAELAEALAEVEARLAEDGAQLREHEAEAEAARRALEARPAGPAAVRDARAQVEEGRKEADALKKIVFSVAAELRRAGYAEVEPVARAYARPRALTPLAGWQMSAQHLLLTPPPPVLTAGAPQSSSASTHARRAAAVLRATWW